MKNIRFRYRKVIDKNSSTSWERMIWEDSFMEFKMQFQLFNTESKFYTFGGLLNNNENAAQLHFLVGGSLLGYLDQLKGVFPNIVNNIGLHFLPIQESRFEIINSDIRDRTKHQVAFNFYSPTMHWHDTIGDYLIVSQLLDVPQEENVLVKYDTHLLQLRPYLTIDQLSNPSIYETTNSGDNIHSLTEG